MLPDGIRKADGGSKGQRCTQRPFLRAGAPVERSLAQSTSTLCNGPGRRMLTDKGREQEA